jgi:hypothetical protein
MDPGAASVALLIEAAADAAADAAEEAADATP